MPDANVLFPLMLRDVFVSLAARDVFDARWTNQIHNEARCLQQLNIMSLTLEIPIEIESELREVAKRHGRELGAYILEAALEQTRREEQERQSRLEALQELTSISEELGLYEWELDVNNRPA